MIEVWVSERALRTDEIGSYGPMRFNARFSTWERAEQERDWYERRGYHVNLLSCSTHVGETVSG